MKYGFVAILLVLSSIHICNAQFQPKGFDDEYGCNYTWKQSAYGANMGVNSMYSGDVDNDGVCEMIFSADFSGNDETTFWYVLEYNQTTGNYDQVFISPASAYGAEIVSIEVFDADNDQEPEVVVGRENGTIEFWNALNFNLERTVTVPKQEYYFEVISGIFTADADNDGSVEFICCSQNRTFLYRLPSFELERTLEIGAWKLKCGNINNDPLIEIIYSDGKVYKVEKQKDPEEITQLIPFTYYYMNNFEMVDFTNDQVPDIVLSAGNRLWVIEGKTFATKFTYTFEHNIRAIAVTDGDGDGEPEIIAAEAEDAQMKCFEIDGTEVWTMDFVWDGISGITGGDLDNDGSPELMWGVGYGVTDDDYIHVCSVPGLTEEWKSTVYDMPYTAVEVGDVDGDGDDEIVTIEAYYGRMTIFDAVTKVTEWRSNTYFGYEPYDMKLFDIDRDGLKEIIVVGQTIKVYNGVTHELEPDFPSFGVMDSWEYRWLEIVDIDNNGTYEYVISNGYRSIIMDPTDGGILWDSSDKVGSSDRSGDKFYDFAVGNLDNDPELEIVTNKSKLGITVYDVPNGEEREIPVPENTTMCLYDYNQDGRLEIMTCEPEGKTGYFDGINYAYTPLLYTLKSHVNHMRFFEYPGAPGPVVAFVYDAKVCCADNTGRFTHDWLIGDETTDEMDITDYDKDGFPELFVVANTMITEVDLSCFLPVAFPEKEVPGRIRIYPNPASSYIIAELPENTERNLTATLYDITGAGLLSLPLTDNRVVIDCTSLAPGIYILKVGASSARVVIE